MAQLHKGRRLMGEINVVPYIDVMLVLLIIFMVTAPLLAQGVKVDLPKASAEPLPPDAEEPLVLSIDKQGRLYLNVGGSPKSPIDDQIAVARAAAALRRAPDKPVLLKADEAIPYGRAVDAMVLLQQAGAKKVGFVTEPLKTRKTFGPSTPVPGEPPPQASVRSPTSAPADAPGSGRAAPAPAIQAAPNATLAPAATSDRVSSLVPVSKG